MESKPTIVLLFTTFPKLSETFLQRDVAALQAKGLNLRIYSLWGGGGEFRGIPVHTFNKWRLVPLFLLIIPWNCLRRPRIVRDLFEGVLARPAPSRLNFLENMLGAGFAGCFHHELRRNPPALVHAAWSGAPATAAWLLWRIHGWRYSCGAHAYDIYDHGGDWWLLEKLSHARFVHTSTESARRELAGRGVPADKLRVIRRGLEAFPPLKPLRRGRTPLRILCVARLVPKKGLEHQLQIYAHLKQAGFPFQAHIVGTGPLRADLLELSARLGLTAEVKFFGKLESPQVWEQFEWADVLVHTGIVAPSGDRDGLPNVIPEAMSAGVLVVSSPVAATTEAVQPERTGLVCDVDLPLAWEVALRRLADDDELAARLRAGARRWTEEHYDAHRNTAQLVRCFEEAMQA